MRYAVINNLSIKAGGTKSTMDLYHIAYEQYELYLKNGILILIYNMSIIIDLIRRKNR